MSESECHGTIKLASVIVLESFVARQEMLSTFEQLWNFVYFHAAQFPFQVFWKRFASALNDINCNKMSSLSSFSSLWGNVCSLNSTNCWCLLDLKISQYHCISQNSGL